VGSKIATGLSRTEEEVEFGALLVGSFSGTEAGAELKGPATPGAIALLGPHFFPNGELLSSFVAVNSFSVTEEGVAETISAVSLSRIDSRVEVSVAPGAIVGVELIGPTTLDAIVLLGPHFFPNDE
jgi:hypothetical protein